MTCNYYALISAESKRGISSMFWRYEHIDAEAFKFILWFENYWILNFVETVPRSPISQTSDKPLTEPMTVLFTATRMRHSASMS